jgi:enoyl-CoA hydratase
VLDVAHRGKVSVVQMRHGKANALDVEFCVTMEARLEELRQSPTQAIVLTGEGRIFSAGVDLLRVLDGGAEYLSIFLPALSKVFETLFCYPKPVVAAINGHAIAGGCVLACAADYRIMAQHAGSIGVPELIVGVPFPTIALEIVRFASAPQYLQGLLYDGKVFSPEDAVIRGLVDTIGETEKLLEQALVVADRLAALPPAAFTVTKNQLREPAMKQIRENGARFDTIVQELWARPESLTAIREYVDRTFKSSKR